MERREVIFTGRVQGVGFRATSRMCALRLAVTGWVRNEADGSVRIEAQGEPAELDRLFSSIDAALGRGITTQVTTLVPLRDDETTFVIAR